MTNCDAGELKRFLTRLAAGAVLLVLMQTGGLIWWAGSITARVDYLERNQSKIIDRLDDAHNHPLAVAPHE